MRAPSSLVKCDSEVVVLLVSDGFRDPRAEMKNGSAIANAKTSAAEMNNRAIRPDRKAFALTLILPSFRRSVFILGRRCNLRVFSFKQEKTMKRYRAAAGV